MGRHGKNYMKSESFHKARLILLDHLENLALKNAMTRKELPYFRYHTYYMRGLYALEHGQPEEAYHNGGGQSSLVLSG